MGGFAGRSLVELTAIKQNCPIPEISRSAPILLPLARREAPWWLGAIRPEMS